MQRIKYLILPYIFLFACASAPIKTPDPTNPGQTLPEKSLIEDIKINYGQAFADCVPVSLETVFRFYGVSIDRKEIADRIQKFSGTKLPEMVSYVKGRGFNIDLFTDETEDKRVIKYFLSQNLPVLVPVGNVRIGHMVVLAGYDDSRRIFYVADPDWRNIQEWRYFDFIEWHRFPGNLGFLVYPRSMNHQTIAYYTKVIESDPNSAEAYSNRGIAFYQKDLLYQAISDYKKAIEINPKFIIVYNNLAWILATTNKPGFRDREKAIMMALKACELSDWKNPIYLETLAMAYSRGVDFENAVKVQEMAMEFPEVANKNESHLKLKFYKERRPWPPDDTWR